MQDCIHSNLTWSQISFDWMRIDCHYLIQHDSMKVEEILDSSRNDSVVSIYSQRKAVVVVVDRRADDNHHTLNVDWSVWPVCTAVDEN